MKVEVVVAKRSGEAGRRGCGEGDEARGVFCSFIFVLFFCFC